MVPKEFSLAGKVAVVGGAGRSWLNTIASALAEAGADIALFGQETKEMEAAAQEAKKQGRRTLTFKTDITNYQQIEKMAGAVVSQWGKIDRLINSFDLQFAKPFTQITDDEWNKVMSINLNAVFLGIRVVSKHMIEKKEGKIITITSGLAERGLPNSAAYCASKAAIGGLTKALALEWARQNIRVNAIALGWMSEGAEAQNSDSKALLTRYVPVARLGKPDDLGAALVYLASDASSFVTGSTYFVTGGVMAHG